jgi:predicted PurR-regulated permease PerM
VSREHLFAAFFLACYVFLLHQLYLFLAPFAAPLVWAAILALTFYPLTTWLTRLFRGSRGLAALVLVFAVTAIAILPSIFLGTMLVREAGQAYTRVQEMVANGELTQLLDRIENSGLGRLFQRLTAPFADRVDLDPTKLILAGAAWVSQQIAAQGGAVARNVLVSLVNGSLMILALFFFFRDGERISGRIIELLPMEGAHKDRVARRLYDTLSAVVQSMIVVSVAQGLLSGIAYWLIGNLPFAVFLGFLTGIASFIPPAGSAFIWLPAAGYLWFTDHSARAILLVLWGAIVVSGSDNVIRTLLIGGRAKMPTFLLLFSILGGLQVYGFLGVFVAPVVVAALLSFVDIYRELYGGAPQAIILPRDADRDGLSA